MTKINFGGLPPEESALETSRFLILPVPYEETVTYLRGTCKGPQAIIEASQHVELYDEELNMEPYRAGIHTLPDVAPEKDPQHMMEKLAARIAELHSTTRTLVTLGGEHSITVGIIKGLKKHYPQLSVLNIDAHADLRNEYEGLKLSHACVARRIYEMVPVVMVGVRSMSLEEAEFIREEEFPLYYASELMAGSSPWEEIVERLSDTVYVSIDLDVFDPSLMPAVGSPEPGGLDWYKTLELLRLVAERRRVVGFDVVELCPIEGLVAPDFLAAKLVYKMIGYISHFGEKTSSLREEKRG
ncbi:MAG: agmatinase [Acidobacteriota bacterium]